MTSAEKPIGVAIIVCDKVITEAGTGNKTLVSAFNAIRSKQFPAQHPYMAVYVALSNATGTKRVELTLSLNEKTVTGASGMVAFPSPNHVVEIVFNFVGLPLLAAGTYAFEVKVDGEFIFERRLEILKVD